MSELNRRDLKTGFFLAGPKSYERLLDDPLVSRWVRSYVSPKTQEDYCRSLVEILKRANLTVKQLLELDERAARDCVMDVVRSYLADQKYAMARQIQTAARSFFDFHDKDLRFKKAERIKKIRKKVGSEVIPTKDQVYAMSNSIKKLESPDRYRTRAIILCLFQSGVRVNCLCRWTVGLVRSQLYPEIKTPLYLKITNGMDTKLSGYGLSYYYTFLQREAAEALRDYLDWRIKNEGSLDDRDLIFKPLRKRSKNKSLDRDRILSIVKSAARRAGLNPETFSTHTLRKSFRKVLNASDIDEDTKEALMGHSLPGSRGNYFNFHDVDEIAQKYMRANFSKEFDIQEVQAAVRRTRELEEDIQRRDLEMQKRERMIKELAEKFEDATKRLEELEQKLKHRS